MATVSIMLAIFIAKGPVVSQVAAPEPVQAQQPATEQGSGTTDTSVEIILRRAKNSFAYGNYQQAAKELRSLLYPMRLYSDGQVIEARHYLGMTYYLLNDLTQAQGEFIKLLYLDPDYELDPFTIAPPIIEVFEAVRSKHHRELDVIRERSATRTLKKPVPQGTTQIIKINTTLYSDLATFMPFGFGQFQQGDYAWGVAFAGTEILLLAINLGSYLWLRTMRTRNQTGGTRPGYAPSKRQLVQALTITQFTSLALFGITWTMGIFHARLRFVPMQKHRSVEVRPANMARTKASTPIFGAGMLWTLDF